MRKPNPDLHFHIYKRLKTFHSTFPDEKGNFEPLRDFVETGKGENGEPHHTKPEQQEAVDKTIEEYGIGPNQWLLI